jgi:hypothetical protein
LGDFSTLAIETTFILMRRACYAYPKRSQNGILIKLCAMDLIGVIADLVHKGVDLRSNWLGDAELLDDINAHAVSLGVADRVTIRRFAQIVSLS